MSLLALAAAGISGGATSADITPDAVNWANISGSGSGSNANQTITGITAPITISLSNSGGGFPSYDLNGAGFSVYSGPFVVTNGQTLRFSVGGSPASGTITVVNDTDSSTTLDTFTYSLTL